MEQGSIPTGVPVDGLVDHDLGPTARIGALARRVAARHTELVVVALERAGLGELRPQHLRIFSALDRGPSRATEIARRLGATKQTVAPVIDELLTMGYLDRSPDPSDGRALLLDFSAVGRKVARQAVAAADEVDEQWAATVGVDRLDECRATLWQLLAAGESVDDAK